MTFYDITETCQPFIEASEGNENFIDIIRPNQKAYKHYSALVSRSLFTCNWFPMTIQSLIILEIYMFVQVV